MMISSFSTVCLFVWNQKDLRSNLLGLVRRSNLLGPVRRSNLLGLVRRSNLLGPVRRSNLLGLVGHEMEQI